MPKRPASGPTSATRPIRTSSTTTPPIARAPGRQAWLDKFKGYLQADAYGGYDGIYATGVTEVACWAHARRKFFDAKDTDGRRAAEMLAMVRELYAVEEARP